MSLEVLTARMLEQSAPWTPWQRRAWDPGTILRLREYLDALEWRANGVLSDSAIAWTRNNLLPLIGQDDGLVSGAVRAQLQELLKKDIAHGSQSQRRLSVLTDYVENQYLQTWQMVVRQQASVHIERTSRFVVSHAIDCGFAPSTVRRVIEDASTACSDPADIIGALSLMVSEPPHDYVGVVPLRDVPEPDVMHSHPDWLPPREANALITAAGGHPSRSQSGALRIRVTARDTASAARTVYDHMERLVSRTRFLRSEKALSYEPTWYINGASHPHGLKPTPRSISAMSLARTGLLYTGTSSTSMDDAFQLAAPMLTGPDSLAASGAWASLESLLTASADWSERGGGRATVADRAACIIAATWPRAEATTLSHRLKKELATPDSLKANLEQAGDNNLRRSIEVIRALSSGVEIPTDDPLTSAALLRLSETVRNPKSVLQRVEGYMRSSLRRLYRQRNIVLHGGAEQPAALEATMRTSSPLVGAVLDRLAHGLEVAEMPPLDVAARSRAALDAVGDASAWPLWALSPDGTR